MGRGRVKNGKGEGKEWERGGTPICLHFPLTLLARALDRCISLSIYLSGGARTLLGEPETERLSVHSGTTSNTVPSPNHP